MRSLFVLLAFSLACLACASPGPKSPPISEEPATFVKAAPRVGQVVLVETAVEFRLDDEAKAEGRAPIRSTTESVTREQRREEILAVFDRIVTKKRVAYALSEHVERNNGGAATVSRSILSGHTYVAEMRSSALVFADASGAPVSTAEAKELGNRLGTLGKPDPFLEALPAGPMQPGRPGPKIAGRFLEVFETADRSSREAPDVGDVDVHFAGVRDEPQGRAGIFVFRLRAQLGGEPSLALDLDGEFAVRLSDSVPLRLEARGPARLGGTMTVEGVTVQMKGEGYMKALVLMRYP
jgi:hypothetical protein